MSEVVLVTGGTSGIGAAAAAALRARGCRVYTLSRRAVEKDALHFQADVTDEAQVRAAVDKLLAAEGRLDVLVNCAGFGISGAAEYTDDADAKRQLDVNLFGTVNATRAVLPAMRERRCGRIVNTSSVAAVVPIPFQLWYSVSKASINTWTMALANEVGRFGISVCAIMPGDTRTGFTDGRQKSAAGDAVYGGAIQRSVERMETDERNGAAPEKVAQVICRAALRRRVRPFYTVGVPYKLAVWVMRVLPSGAANRLIGKLYAK